MPSFTFVSNLPASGDMARRIRQMDWSGTGVGSPAGWPATLRVALEVALLSRIPSYIAWGPTHLLLYNDAYAAILGSKHPQALGMPFPEVWPEAWEELRPVFQRARGCDPSFARDQRQVVRSDGVSELAYFTHSYVPLFKAPGSVGG